MTSPLRPAEMLAIVGVKLSTLPRRVVFIGGATTELFITDPAAAAVRSTIDVDVIVDVESRVQYQATLEQAREQPLRDGTVILVATGPLFLATKIEAFRGRGGGDYFASKDMEDIITVLDGRPEIVEEVNAVEPGLRSFLRDAFAEWLKRRGFADVVAGHLVDLGGQGRAEVALERMASITRRG